MKILWLNLLKPNEIAINNTLYKELSKPKKIILHYGMLKLDLKVQVINKLSVNEIGLPKNLTDKYTIPKEIPYEVYFSKGELHIGPIIAHISLGSNQFRKKSYAYNLPAFLDYESIKGLIITCTEDAIDIDSGVIEGYYLDPKEKNLKKAWKEGRFPLPDAIFNHSFMSQEKVKAIQNIIGDKLFNSYLLNLDKWETWKFLSQNDTLRKNIPYTEELKNMKQLKLLLSKYGSLYLKPSNEGGGIGIMKLDKTKEGISLVENDGKVHDFKDDVKFYKFLEKKIGGINKQTARSKTNNPLLYQFLGKNLTTPYIIQQAVHFKKNNRHVDFRLVLQKDSSKNWAYTGLVARIAQEGSIITNKRGRDKMIDGKKALTNLYGLDKDTAKRVQKEMTNIVTRAVEMYEKLGYHLGDVVADIALDADLNIWLLELQLYYSINGWYTEGLRDFYVAVATTPFKYAKALAGFTNS